MKGNDKLIETAKKRWRIAADSDKKDRLQYVEDLNMATGNDQWHQDVRAVRMEASPPRPCLTINKIAEKVNLIDGDFRQAKPSIKVRPVDSFADPVLAEVLEGLIANVEYQSDAGSIYSTAFSTMIMGGRGAWRINLKQSVDDVFAKDIILQRIPNPLTVYSDPAAMEVNRSDRKWLFVTEWITKEELEATYPKASLSSWDSDAPGDGNDWYEENRLRIAEYWWTEEDKKMVYRVKISETEYIVVDKLEEGMEADAEEEVVTKKVKYCKMNGGEVLEGPTDWPGSFIPIIEVYGRETWIEGERATAGLVRHAKEPQRLYNYWSSAITESVALAPTAPWLLTPGMLGNHKRMWDTQSERNYPYLVFDPDKSLPGYTPQRQPPPQLSSAMANELQRLEHDIMSTMGLYASSLGAPGPEVSGRAILARQKKGDVGSYAYIDTFAHALTFSGKVLIDLIPKVYVDERVLRILGPTGQERHVEVNKSATPEQAQGMARNPQYQGPTVMRDPEVSKYMNDLTIGKYDVRTTIGSSYATQRQEAAESLIELVRAIPNAGMAAADLIVKNLDMPGSAELEKRLRKMVPLNIRELDEGEQPPPPPPPDPKLEIEVQKLQLQIEKLRTIEQPKAIAKAILDIAKAEAQEVGSQVNEYRAMLDTVVAANTPQAPPQAPQGPQGPQKGIPDMGPGGNGTPGA